MKKWFLSLLIQFFIYAPFIQAWAAEQPVNIREILVKVTSSVTGQELGANQLQSFSSQYLSESPQQLAAQALSSTSVQSYFPLNNNDTKHYSGSVYGTQYSTTMSYLTAFFNGRSCFRENDSIDGSIAYYGHNSGQLEMYGAAVEGLDLTFNTPLVILNDSILTNGGSLHSSTSLVVEGVPITVNLIVSSASAGNVSTSLGTVENCRTVDMSFSYIIPGESDTLDLRDVWVLGPGIGKIKIGMMDQNLNNLGWMTINGGTVAGQTVYDIINPPEPDGDNDGVADSSDNCPATSNANQADEDGDHIGDVCDNCPKIVNADQIDTDGDMIGDACETRGMSWLFLLLNK